jgi:hypothetical protein
MARRKKKLSDKEFRARAAELLRQELKEPERWWYLSFADPGKFNGAIIIQAHGMTDALTKINWLGINPGGQVQAIPFRPEVAIPEEKWRNRLLTREELDQIWPDVMSTDEIKAWVKEQEKGTVN